MGGSFGLEREPPSLFVVESPRVSVSDDDFSAPWFLLSNIPRPKIALSFCQRFLGPPNHLVASKDITFGLRKLITSEHFEFRLMSS